MIRILGLALLVLGLLAPAASAQSAEELFEQSRGYAVDGNPKAALSAVEQALALQPQAPEYLRARATLATWLGDYRRAQDSYRRLAALHQNDVDIVLSSARVSAWAGDTDAAVDGYRRYLTQRPDSADVWLELAKTESWRGNYAAATSALDEYRRRFGNSPALSRQLAAVMAGAGRPGKAEAVLTPLLRQSPDDYELSLAHTLALAGQQRSKDAFASLETLRRLAPERPETRAAARTLRSLLSSSAESPVTIYSDSDRLERRQVEPSATVALASGTRFSGGYTQTVLEAKTGSGLERLNGSGSARYEHTWAAIGQKIGPFTLSGQSGYARTHDDHLTTYVLGADVRATDSLRLVIDRSRDYFVVSPRTIGAGIIQTGDRLQAEWSPTLGSHVALDSSYQELSDGNRRLMVAVSPRHSIARTALLNLDLGVSAYQLRTQRDFDNGYYDPRLYEQYAAVVYPYFKFSENVGLGLTLAAGAQRERRSRVFSPGGSVTAEATFGIYQSWVLKVTSAATVNRRLDSGAFQGFNAGMALIRRF